MIKAGRFLMINIFFWTGVNYEGYHTSLDYYLLCKMSNWVTISYSSRRQSCSGNSSSCGSFSTSHFTNMIQEGKLGLQVFFFFFAASLTVVGLGSTVRGSSYTRNQLSRSGL